MKQQIKTAFFLIAFFAPAAALHCAPKPVLMAEGGVIHRFFDTSPISPSGKYAAFFRFPYENRKPRAGDAGEVVVIELASMRQVFSAKTRGWETQMGANVQWGASDAELFYNDADPKSWDAFAVCLDFKSGEKRRLEGTVFMASPDGKKLVSHNLKKSRFAQVGYGVVVPDAFAKRNRGLPDDDGIFVTDALSGKCRLIASIRDIWEKSVPPIKEGDPDKLECYCFQAKWNPQMTRVLATIQWTPIGGGKRRRAVVTMKPDGSDIRTAITPAQWAAGGHHVNWLPDGERVSMNLNIDGKKGLEIITAKYDGTDLKKVYDVGSGHPSYHPNGLPFILTDAYAGELPLPDGRSPIRLINVETQSEVVAVKTSLPPIVDPEFRVDAHPVWVLGGSAAVYNDTKDGKRCVYLIDLSEFLKPAKNARNKK